MIRRSPSEYYLKYLVSHNANYSNEIMAEKFLQQGLDWLGPEYVERVRRQTVRPVPFRPYDREHLSSQVFLNKHRIYTLYFPDVGTKGAQAILEQPKIKEFIESMLLTGAPHILIARGASYFSPAPVCEAAVRRFEHYFWNTALVDFTEMRALVAKRGSNSPDKDFKKAHYRDSRRIACDLPFNPLSAVLAQLRMGITPTNIDFADLMDKVRVISGIKAYQWLLEDSQFSGQNARDFITVAVSATDLLERAANPEEKLRERINSLNLNHDAVPIPHIKQLSEGRHTTDLQATEAKAEVVEVEDES